MVIAVNSDNWVLDTACKLFSAEFYNCMLEGFSIYDSYEHAKSHIQLDPCDFSTCCCSH